MVEPTVEALAEALAGRRDWAIRTLGELVRRPSVLGHEEPAQEFLAGELERLGYAVHVEPIERARIEHLPGFSPVDWKLEGKKNVVAIHDPGPGGRSLAFNGHIDVVSPEPVSLWTGDPFEPRIVKDGDATWMIGRGAGDMKGGTVAYLWALAALRDMDLEPASKVICQSPVEEECTGNGTLAILERGHVTDACIIPEPFEESLLSAQVGVMWFQVRVLGRTNHVLATGQGVNAIEKSWLIVQALRELEAEINRPEAVTGVFEGVPHPLNLNVGVIHGGDWASTVAGECVTRYRIGLLPGQRCEDLRRRIEECVAAAAAADPWLREFPPRVEYVGFQAEGCTATLDGPFGAALRGAHRSRRGRDPFEYRSTATTDVRFFELQYDIPATCYGPTAENIHGIDERVNLASVARVAEVLAAFVQDWCGLRARKGAR